MYAPLAQAQPVLDPASVAPLTSASALLAPPVEASLHTRLTLTRTALNVLAGHAAVVSGTLRPGLPGRIVTLQALGVRGWLAVARARTSASGRFRLRYVPRRVGSERVRIRFSGDAAHLASRRRLGRLNVYRPVGASWYGGGGSLACGGSLTDGTMGVASRTLPCGTLVTLRYAGRSVRVPVVDRGPYVTGREFDLTPAVKVALGFGDTGEVWSTR
jgi:rare lipoprotein A